MRKWININIIGLALALALVAVYLLKYDSPVLTGTVQRESSESEDEPYSFLHKVSVTQYGDNGKIRHKLNASNIKRYNEDQRLVMSQPNVSLHQNGAVVAKARALTGISFDEGQQIELTNNVVVEDIQHDASLKTTHIIVNTVLRQVLTDQLVRLETPHSTTRAKGLHLDIPNQKWRLASEVESVLRP